MSEQQLSYGVIVPLTEWIEDERREEIGEILFDFTTMQINYEGTLIFIDSATRDDVYGGMFIMDVHGMIQEMKKDLKEFVPELNVDFTRWYPYCSSWYNGTDSHMSTFTLADFRLATLS